MSDSNNQFQTAVIGLLTELVNLQRQQLALMEIMLADDVVVDNDDVVGTYLDGSPVL